MFQAGIEETPSRVLVYFARQRNARSFMCLNYYPRSCSQGGGLCKAKSGNA